MLGRPSRSSPHFMPPDVLVIIPYLDPSPLCSTLEGWSEEGSAGEGVAGEDWAMSWSYRGPFQQI